NVHYISTAQVNWGRLEYLPELNRVTAGAFFHLIRAVGLGVAYARMLPFGRHFLARRGASGRRALHLLEAASQLPLLREVLATKMVFVLTKAPGIDPRIDPQTEPQVHAQIDPRGASTAAP